eukprot:358848-Chlamydomonas_euryale.AAC.3
MQHGLRPDPATGPAARPSPECGVQGAHTAFGMSEAHEGFQPPMFLLGDVQSSTPVPDCMCLNSSAARGTAKTRISLIS